MISRSGSAVGPICDLYGGSQLFSYDQRLDWSVGREHTILVITRVSGNKIEHSRQLELQKNNILQLVKL